MLHSSWERAAEGRRTAAIVGGSSAEVARWNRTERTDFFAHKLRRRRRPCGFILLWPNLIYSDLTYPNVTTEANQNGWAVTAHRHYFLEV